METEGQGGGTLNRILSIPSFVAKAKAKAKAEANPWHGMAMASGQLRPWPKAWHQSLHPKSAPMARPLEGIEQPVDNEQPVDRSRSPVDRRSRSDAPSPRRKYKKERKRGRQKRREEEEPVDETVYTVDERDYSSIDVASLWDIGPRWDLATDRRMGVWEDPQLEP